MAGDRLDLSSDPQFSSQQAEEKPAGRRYIGIHFVCCDVYTRIYLNHNETAYEGHCPKCCHRVKILIGPGGTSNRFFQAY